MSFYTTSGGPPISEAMYNGGTALSQALSVGTADNYALTIVTNGTAALSIDTSQNVTVAGSLTITGGTIFTGQIESQNGTAAAPGVAFLNDLDCGMYRISTNTVGFATNGTLALTLDSSQNLTVAGRLVVSGAGASVSSPNLNVGDGGTGIYKSATNEMSIAVNGIQNTRFGAAFAYLPISVALNVLGTAGQTNTIFTSSSTDTLSIGGDTTAANGGLIKLTSRSASPAHNIGFYSANTLYGQFTSTGSFILGNAAIATNATDGFIYINSCAGAATGTPTAATGRVPLVFDSTNGRLYAYYGGAWKYQSVAT